MESQKPVHTIVLDTGAIIRNDPSVSTLLAQSENIVTVPAIISEIRDAATRSRVETTLLPFLTLRSPNATSLKFVSDFARRTGDLTVLSKPDIQIIALAYELECERNNGDWRLRKAPGQKGMNGSPPKKEEVGGEQLAVGNAEALKDDHLDAGQGAQEEPAQVNPESKEAEAELEISPDTVTAAVKEPQQEKSDQETTADTQTTEQPTEQPVEQPVEHEKPVEKPAEPTVGEVEDAIAKTNLSSGLNTEQADAPDTAVPSQAVQEEASPSDESDSEGWITPSNLKKHQAKDAMGSVSQSSEPKTMQVATLTTDFAMQNVILQINLNLLSPTLQRIKHLKTFVLRCHACFQTTKEMNKQFCPRCGKPTLTRVACSTNANGEFKLHLKKNMQWNHRGDRYSIPKAVHGSANGRVAGGGKGGWGNELILAEDQKEYMRAMSTEKRRKERDLMDEDYLPSILTGDRGKTGGRTRVGAGKNVNSKKR